MALTKLFTEIANAIRDKNGTTEKIVAENFPKEINNLKSSIEHVELAYIEGTGTQYIDTGIIPTNHTIEIKCRFTTYQDNKTVFGTNNFNYHLTWFNNRWYYTCGTGEKTFTGAWNKLQTIIFNNADRQITVDGSVVATTEGTTPAIDSIHLFRRGSGGDTGNSSIQVYYCKIYDRTTNKLVRDFVPVLTKTKDVCLYDKISKTYFYNQGTDNFVIGL